MTITPSDPIDCSRDKAIQWLNQSAHDIERWIQLVRGGGDERGLFRWSVQTTRPANVPSSAYILSSLGRMGRMDLIGEAERQRGVAWIQSLNRGGSQYADPAILDRRPPKWPEDKPWPDAPTQAVLNQYAHVVLKNLGMTGLPDPPPPEGFFSIEDAPRVMDKVRGLIWDTNAWGAGSWCMRYATWLLEWWKAGKIGIEPLIEVLDYLNETQDPQTGLWGGPNNPRRQTRINGAFKLFVLTQDQLALPLPHAAKIIDQVLAEWARPDYDERTGGCDDWDNLYVVAMARAHTHERDELIQAAVRNRLARLPQFQQADGGFSYYRDRCGAAWLAVDMSPSVRQGDASGMGMWTSAVNVCVDLLDLKATSPWTGRWRLREPEAPSVREQILSRLRGTS